MHVTFVTIHLCCASTVDVRHLLRSQILDYVKRQPRIESIPPHHVVVVPRSHNLVSMYGSHLLSVLARHIMSSLAVQEIKSTWYIGNLGGDM